MHFKMRRKEKIGVHGLNSTDLQRNVVESALFGSHSVDRMCINLEFVSVIESNCCVSSLSI